MSTAPQSYTHIVALVDDLEAPERDELLWWFLAQVNPDAYPTLALAITRIVRDRKPPAELTLPH